MHVLGIDAGGTKTVCLLADDQGTILEEARGPAANLQTAGELVVEKVLHEVMEGAIGDRAITPLAICLGMAGVDRDEEWRVVRAMMRRIGHTPRTLVVNDALIALVAGAGDSPGIVIIAGTGSIAYGRNARGEAARAGGWGHLIGDEGSAYWIGREALAAVMRAADGRGPLTRLAGDVVTHFGVGDVSGLPRIVYDRETPRWNVAALGPIVQNASEEGDAVARHILERAADELVLAVQSVASRLEMRGDPFICVLAGGAFRGTPWLADEMPRRLVEVAPLCQVRVLEEEPAIGAVRLALAEVRGGAHIPRYKE
jgi:N-acetylglucosamine kinase-like BadF-type ATPase